MKQKQRQHGLKIEEKSIEKVPVKLKVLTVLSFQERSFKF